MANARFIHRTWARVAAIAGIAVLVGIVAVFRAHGLRSAEARARLQHVREVERAIAEGQRVFRALPVSPLDSFGSAAEVEAHLRAAIPAATDGRVSPSAQDAVLKQAAELVFLHFVHGSPAEYREWRQARGYKLRDAASMRRYAVASDYEYWFKEPYPGDEHLVEVFDRLWEATLSARGGRSRPVAIASGSGGIQVAFGRLDRAGLDPPPEWFVESPKEAWEGTEAWEGKQQGLLGRDWWTDPNGGIREELRRRPSVSIAVIRFIMEMSAGDRYPISFTFYQSGDGSWWLWRVNAHNVAADRLVQLEF